MVARLGPSVHKLGQEHNAQNIVVLDLEKAVSLAVVKTWILFFLPCSSIFRGIIFYWSLLKHLGNFWYKYAKHSQTSPSFPGSVDGESLWTLP